jgi:hypothetical protein
MSETCSCCGNPVNQSLPPRRRTLFRKYAVKYNGTHLSKARYFWTLGKAIRFAKWWRCDCEIWVRTVNGIAGESWFLLAKCNYPGTKLEF